MQKHIIKHEVKHAKIPKRKIYAKTHDEVMNPFTATLADKDEVIVRMDLPDVNEEDILIGFAKGNLTVDGLIKTQEMKETAKGTRIERHKKTFHKEIPLPQRIDPKEIKVTFDDGMLEIKLPMKQEEIEA